MSLSDFIFLFHSFRRSCNEGGTLLWAEVLYLIAEAQRTGRPNGLDIAQLARKSGGDDKTIRNVVHYLGQHGLIQRSETRLENPDGMAAYLYRLTAKGEALVPAPPEAIATTAPDEAETPALFPES